MNRFFIEFRKPTEDFGLIRVKFFQPADIARAFFIKDESQSPRALACNRSGVREVCDAANFYLWESSSHA